jgi:curli biogenesis system outer membrane secretion channel CsgG
LEVLVLAVLIELTGVGFSGFCAEESNGKPDLVINKKTEEILSSTRRQKERMKYKIEANNLNGSGTKRGV